MSGVLRYVTWMVLCTAFPNFPLAAQNIIFIAQVTVTKLLLLTEYVDILGTLS